MSNNGLVNTGMSRHHHRQVLTCALVAEAKHLCQLWKADIASAPQIPELHLHVYCNGVTRTAFQSWQEDSCYPIAKHM